MIEIDFAQALDKVCLKYRPRVALDVGGREYTYGEVAEVTDRLANAFISLGLLPGDRLAIMTTNRAEYLFADFAAAKAGLIKVPLNVMLSNQDIDFRLRDSQARAVLLDPFFLDKTKLFFKDLDFIEHVILVDDGDGGGGADGGLPDELLDLRTLVASAPARPPSLRLRPEDPMAIMYTGGTTGQPKGVVHTHKSCMSIYFSEMVEMDIVDNEVMLICAPLPHATGFLVPPCLFRGGRVVVAPGFSPESFLDLVEQKGVSWTFVVPTMIYALLDHPSLAERDLGSLRTVVYGAAPILVSRLEEAWQRLGPIFIQGYSQMEVACQTTILTKDQHREAIERGDRERLLSCGQPILMSQVRIVDESGQDVAAGEVGEIITRGPHMMAGYWGRPEETAETVKDGWIYTGDLARADQDGFIYLVDRKHDLIITGGLNVYSTEVENVLARHPAVAQAVVIGAPDDKWGERVTAVVVPRPDAAADPEELRAWCRQRLSSYKVPKSIEFRDEIPQTAYGKFDKKAVRAEFWSGRERMI